MPLDVFREDDCVLGELSAWRFIDRVAVYLRNPLFGFETACQQALSSTEGPGGMRLSGGPSLWHVLGDLIDSVHSHSTASYYSLVDDDSGSWFIREQPFSAAMQSWQVEQYMIAIIIGMARSFAGPRWLPTIVHVSGATGPARIPEEWKPIDFHWGERATRILLPSHGDKGPGRGPGSSMHSSPLNVLDLIETQVRLGRPDISAAARELGVSTSTIKRRLRQLGATYRRAVEAARIARATKLLAGDKHQVTQIATQLGYGYLPNFTRAFKRATGVSPSAYRRRNS